MKFKNTLNEQDAKRFCDFCHEHDVRQIFELIYKLDDCEIPYEIEFLFGGFHIGYPSLNPRERVCSVILHVGSYGNEDGLLEIQGLLTPEEQEMDSVAGYLDADDVFHRIKMDFGLYMRDHCHVCMYRDIDDDEEDFKLCATCGYGRNFKERED